MITYLAGLLELVVDCLVELSVALTSLLPVLEVISFIVHIYSINRVF